MHHFNETETQWTYRGPWAFYSTWTTVTMYFYHWNKVLLSFKESGYEISVMYWPFITGYMSMMRRLWENSTVTPFKFAPIKVRGFEIVTYSRPFNFAVSYQNYFTVSYTIVVFSYTIAVFSSRGVLTYMFSIGMCHGKDPPFWTWPAPKTPLFSSFTRT